MKNPIFLFIASSVVGLMSAEASTDCGAVALSVKSAVKADSSKVLEIVSTDVASSPGCACEIVKAAIETTNAKPQAVAAIVEAAVLAAPEHLRLIFQCAVAVAPDSFDAVQAVLVKLGLDLETSGEVARKSKFNPLDFPGRGPIGPQAGLNGGLSLVFNRPPSTGVTPVVTKVVTKVNP